MKKSLIITACATVLLGAGAIVQEHVLAHGYVSTPAARGYQGSLDKAILGWTPAFEKYGNVITNPQSLEAPKGFPLAGPADGRLASANGGSGQIGDFILDEQNSDRWTKSELSTGVNTFTWSYTAPHATSKWHYYMTKEGWDQNKALTRDSLELIGEINHDGSTSTNNLSHQVTVPSDRQGYHVILAVWDVADTPNAFYNVIDVNVKNDGVAVKPEAPKGLNADRVTSSTASLSWTAQSNASSYVIYRDGVKISETTSAQFEDKDLLASTQYVYQVQAKNSQGVSKKSSKLAVTTSDEVTPEKPSTPSGLHTMAVTEESVDLMFASSSHTTGIKEYQIYRDGKLIGTSNETRYLDKNLMSGTEYVYQVIAISNSNEISDKSDALKVQTKSSEKPGGGDSSDVREFKLGTFFEPENYTAGETVQSQGKLYKVVQSHANYGDATWAPGVALALFTEVK